MSLENMISIAEKLRPVLRQHSLDVCVRNKIPRLRDFVSISLWNAVRADIYTATWQKLYDIDWMVRDKLKEYDFNSETNQ